MYRPLTEALVTILLLVSGSGCGTLIDVQVGTDSDTPGTGGTSTSGSDSTLSSPLDDTGTSSTTGDPATSSTTEASSGTETGSACHNGQPEPQEYCHQEQRPIMLGMSVKDAEIGDVDGSTHADLVLSLNSSPARVVVMLGSDDGLQNSGGSTVELMDISESMPRDIALGNFGGDPRLELAVPTDTDLRVFHSSDSTFAGSSILNAGAFFVQVVAGQLDNDEWSDLVATDSASWDLELFPGNGMSPELNTGSPFDPGDFMNYTAALIDADGDAQLDLVLTGTAPVGGREVRFFPGMGDSFTTSTRPLSIDGLSQVAHGDLDDDADDDLELVVTIEDQPMVTVYRHDPSFVYTELVTFMLAQDNPTLIALADVDSDGLDDLISVHDTETGHSLLVSCNTGDGTAFEMRDMIELSAAGQLLRVGDVNGDSVPDVVVVLADNTVVQLLSHP